MLKISPKAFFFDFDGVICDSERAHMFATLKVAKPYQINFSEEYYFEKLFGFDDKKLFEFLFEKHGKKLPASNLKKLIKDKNSQFMEMIASSIIYFKGVIPLIKTIHEKNIPTAIVSGALEQEITACLAMDDLNKYFKYIISANMVTNCKPDPECYELGFQKMALSISGLKHSDCWVLEDSPVGVVAAKKAGMKTIGITNSTTPANLSSADHIVSSYDEIEIV